MRRLEHDRGGNARFEGLLPARGDDAPAIARLEAGEHPLRLGGDEVVPAGHREGEELLGHDGADDLEAGIDTTCMAVAIAVEASQRVEAARLEIAAVDVHRSRLR